VRGINVNDMAAETEFTALAHPVLTPVTKIRQTFGQRIELEGLSGIKFKDLKHAVTS